MTGRRRIPIAVSQRQLWVRLVRKAVALSAVAAPAVLPHPIHAQADSAQLDTIVVKGTALDPAQARRRAIEFVERTGVAKGQQQVARWITPACIKLFGLAPHQAAMVQGAMLDIARQADIPSAEAGCRPNITVTFAPDAGEVIRHIHARKPQQLREMSASEREQLLNGMAPIRWWYATQNLSREGIQSNGTTVHFVGSGGEEHISTLPAGDGATVTQQHNGGSNVRTPIVRALYRSNVVIDARQVSGKSLESIAAYVAMVAFAEIDPGAVPSGSILRLFESNEAEAALSDWDRAFLKSLYRLPPDRRSRVQRGHLIEALLDYQLPREVGKP